MNENGKLNYTDPIGKFLDAELIKDLLIVSGHEYSGKITICHLLMKTFGRKDVFYHL